MGIRIVSGVSAVIALSAIVSVSAQVTRPTAQPPLPKPDAPVIQKAGEPVTLTGCIKTASAPAATEAARSTPPEGRMAMAAHSYLLANVEDKERPTNKEGKTYALIATSGVNIAEHLGHKVEIKGMLQGVEAPLFKPTSPAGETKTADPHPVSAWPVISVTSLQMVASTCGTTLY